VRKGTLFWGTAIILIGVVLLISNVTGIALDRFIWPLVMIALGAWILWGAFAAPKGSQGFETEEATIPLEGATKARIRINHGAGKLSVGSGAGPDQLVSGSFCGGMDYERTQDGDTTNVNMGIRASIRSLANPWMWSPGRSLDWSVSLNDTIPLSLELQTGANDARVDLTDLQVTELQLQTGASSTRITLPAVAGYTKAALHSGAASVSVRVPSGVAARIRARSGIAEVRVDRNRFPQVGDVYQSEDYDKAGNKVDIEIETGVGSVDVK
jgi:hypothetical protein